MNFKIGRSLQTKQRVIPYDHRGKIIESTNKTKKDINFLCEAFKKEEDSGLRKLIVLRIMELLNITTPLEINECLYIYDVDQVNIKEMVEALKWQLPY